MNFEQRLPNSRRHVLRVPSPQQSLMRFFRMLELWHKRIEERRQLLELSDRILRDIGVSRGDIVREASKPFWRA